jgi:hypothetical protein
MKKLFLILLSLSSLSNVFSQNLLTQKEQEAISYMREEEKLARDIYDSMFENML